MKMFKMALLGGAALAVSAAGAQADDLTALKAQIESLNARVASMEAAPSVPAGYSLLTISEGRSSRSGLSKRSARTRLLTATKATVISVLPTADAPAATDDRPGRAMPAPRSFIRTAMLVATRRRSTSMPAARSRLSARPTPPSVKLVRRVEFRGNFDGQRRLVTRNPCSRDVHRAGWGWWAMTPELTLGGGFTGSLGNIGYGYDGACNCYYTDNADVAMNPGDTSQMRLSYASGPFSMRDRS